MKPNRILAALLVTVLAAPPALAPARADITGPAGMLPTGAGAVLPQALGNLGLQVAAKCNVVETLNDGSIAAASNQFTSSAITFTTADIGKSIVISGAGAAGAPLATTIAAGSYPGHTATLAATATTAVPNLAVEDVQPATKQSGAGSYAPGNTITLAGGTSTTAAIATVDLTEVQSATVAAGGSGGTNGTQTVTGTTGTVLGTSGFFTASVTVSGNAITAVLSIIYGGLYSTNPTLLTAEPVTGAGLVGATLNLKMGVQNAHPSTAGVYSVTAGTLTQASTSGSGTGATFTPTFNQADWYYGNDDGAAINTALGQTAYNGSFLLPAGGCGTTVPIVLPATLPWPSPVLRGQGKGLTRLYALGAMAQVIDTGTTYSQGGGLRDLTVDAHKLATDGIMVRRGAVMSFINVAAKNALTAEWGSAAGSGGHFFNQIEGYTDPGVFPAALRSTYNFDASSMTDSSILSSVFYNAVTANINDGAANKWLGDHTYGFPVNFEAQYGVKISGNSQFIGHEFDGAAVAQLRLNGGPATVSGVVQWANNTIGAAHGVEIANGIANINTSGLVFNPANGNIPNAQAVVLDSGLPSQSVLTNYPNIGDVNLPGNLTVGGALTVAGNLTQTGTSVTFNGPPSAGASLNLVANQTSGTNAGIFPTPRTAAFGVGILETGNLSDLLLGTNFSEALRIKLTTNDVLIGTTTDCSQKLCVNGTANLGIAGTTTGALALNGSTSGTITIKTGVAPGTQTLTVPNLRESETLAIRPQNSQATPGNPTGTASTTGVMMGLAGAITPQVTGNILVILSGDIASGTTGDGAKVQLRTGTGTAPVNAAALAGTTCGGLVNYTAAAAGGDKVPFSLNCIVSGLTVGTAIWIDVGLAAITGGTASVADLSLTAYEL